MNLQETYNKASNGLSNVLNLVATHKETIGRTVINCALLLIVLIVTGCLDFMHPTLHFEFLMTISYWTTIVSKLIGGLCTFNIGINLFWDLEIKRNEALDKAIEQYNILITYKQVDFEEFVVEYFNPAEKKKAYISQMNRKIYLLNKVSKRKDKLLYSSKVEGAEELRKTNKYCIRRAELEALKTEEYINENLDTLEVRYREVDPSIFELEIDGNQKITGVKTKGNANVGRVKASSTVLLGIIATTTFFTAIGFEFNQQEFVETTNAAINYALKCVMDVGILIWQFIRGSLIVKKIISSEVTEPYVGRVQVLTHYLEWRIKEKKGTSETYKILHETTETEMTQEELDKLLNKKEN